MMVRQPWLTFLAAVGLLAAACGTASSSWDGDVTLQVDIEEAQRWTASGAPVDRGAFCPNGIRAVLDAVDVVTGERLPMREEVRIIGAVVDEPVSPPVVWTIEHSCADGSGSFVTEENWDTGTWTVASGTGSYRALAGDGALSFTTSDYTSIGPRRLTVEAHLSGTSPR